MKRMIFIISALCLMAAAPAAYAQYTYDNPPQTLPKNENPYASLNPPTSSNPYAQMTRETESQAPRKDRMMFNHASLGFTFGGGFGLQMAAPLTPYGQVRAGYVFPSNLTIRYKKTWISEYIGLNEAVDELQKSAREQLNREIDMNKVKLGMQTNLGGPYLMLDLFPGRDVAFHLTAGAFYCASTDLYKVALDASGALLPSEYTNEDGGKWLFLTLNYDKDVRISPDPDGVIFLKMKSERQLRPYVGIGFGRAVSARKRVTFTVDFGALYTGKTIVYGVNYSNPDPGDYGNANPNYVNGNPPYEIVPVTSDTFVDQDGIPFDTESYLDQVNDFPFRPMMKFGLHFRLF